jgi:predicted cobalt transporter CbtA
MAVLRRLVFAALCAGLLSGIFATGAHQIATVPVILKAEAYEKAPERATAEAHQHAAAWEPENGADCPTSTARHSRRSTARRHRRPLLDNSSWP